MTTPVCPSCGGARDKPQQLGSTDEGMASYICPDWFHGSEAYSKTPEIEGIKTNPAPPSAGEVELEQILLSLLDWSHAMVSFPGAIAAAKAAINAYVARRVLEVIGEDETENGAFADINEQAVFRNALRREQRQRIAVTKKESQQ
jgi:hypothetical protein